VRQIPNLGGKFAIPGEGARSIRIWPAGAPPSA